jgi:peptidoglycan/LPS O-acetylase OafA/YrhL
MKINNFRHDINGLRAYAVILVVLFHFNIIGFSSGFIGVDIFFVISGFLMTKIIVDKILYNQFSLTNFILARSIRILPALLVVTLTIAIIGWFILTPGDYRKYGAYALSSVAFFSNFLYWKKTGDYFSTNAHDIPLLHTWSLSVEWQFYIVFPIILWLITRIKNNKFIIKVTVLSLIITSFILSITLTNNNQTSSFFMLHTRAWEMLAGGLVYLFFNNNYKNKNFEILGVLLIITSLFLINENTIWPGYMALFPVLGSMFIIIGNNRNSLFFKSKITQKIGDWSYSIYLWHWPIVFFINYLDEKSVYISIFGIGLSIFLGMLSYKLIETPTRKYLSNIKKTKSLIFLTTSVFIFCLIYSLIFIKSGFINRASQDYLLKTNDIKMPRSNDSWCFYDFNDDSFLKVGTLGQQCFVGSKASNANTALLIGDSFAGHNSPFWDVIGKNLNIKIRGISTNWCYPSLNDDYTGPKDSIAYKQCLLNRDFFKKNYQNYDYIILAGMWSAVKEKNQISNLQILINHPNLKNKKIIIMDEPYALDVKIGDIYKRKIWLNKNFDINPYILNSKAIDQEITSNLILDMSKNHPNIFFIKRDHLFSKKQVTSENIPYSLEGTHISVYGSLQSAYYFKKEYEYIKLQDFLRK